MRLCAPSRALLLTLPALVSSQEPNDAAVIGYFVSEDSTITASCTGEKAEWQTYADDRGGCRRESNNVKIDSMGFSCSETEVYISQALATGKNTNRDYYTVHNSCGDCVTLTVYDEAPDVTPAVEFITCAESFGLPATAETLYRSPPEEAADDDGSADSSSGGSSGDSGSSSGAGAGTIAGAVVGSVAGVAILMAAALLIRRHLKKTYAKPTQPPPNGHSANLPHPTRPHENPPAGPWASIPQGLQPRAELSGQQAPPSELGAQGPSAAELRGGAEAGDAGWVAGA